VDLSVERLLNRGGSRKTLAGDRLPSFSSPHCRYTGIHYFIDQAFTPTL
jgi:hypothetical protein